LRKTARHRPFEKLRNQLFFPPPDIFPFSSFYDLFSFADSSWGISKFGQTPRQQAAKFTLKYYEYDPSRLGKATRLSQISAYDRCKANRRCNYGIVGRLAFDAVELVACI
jgi:hypothetical protein